MPACTADEDKSVTAELERRGQFLRYSAPWLLLLHLTHKGECVDGSHQIHELLLSCSKWWGWKNSSKMSLNRKTWYETLAVLADILEIPLSLINETLDRNLTSNYVVCKNIHSALFSKSVTLKASAQGEELIHLVWLKALVLSPVILILLCSTDGQNLW